MPRRLRASCRFQNYEWVFAKTSTRGNLPKPSIDGSNTLQTHSAHNLPRYPLKPKHWSELHFGDIAIDGSNALQAHSAQIRLTRFHGTSIPMHVIFFLEPADLRRLRPSDVFWRRATGHVKMWRALYCRDYGLTTKEADLYSCAWRTLQGKSGDDHKLCLFHLRQTNPSEFSNQCRDLTSIPGRSKAELMHDYVAWRRSQRQTLLKATKDGPAPAAWTLTSDEADVRSAGVSNSPNVSSRSFIRRSSCKFKPILPVKTSRR